MSSRKATIDVHHHVPPGYMLSSSSQSNAWSIASDMEAMDRMGIDEHYFLFRCQDQRYKSEE